MRACLLSQKDANWLVSLNLLKSLRLDDEVCGQPIKQRDGSSKSIRINRIHTCLGNLSVAKREPIGLMLRMKVCVAKTLNTKNTHLWLDRRCIRISDALSQRGTKPSSDPL